MIFLMHGHFDLKKSHFDSRNRVPDVGLITPYASVGGLGESPFHDIRCGISLTKELRKQWVWMKLTHVIHLGQDGSSTTGRWCGRFLWYLLVLAVVVHPDIHMVLTVCGFVNVVDHMSIINNEGFQLIAADFGILEDKDMFEMVKCLGGHMVVADRVNVEAIQVKKLQALCYWVHDQQKHGQGITQDNCLG
jgi:hypothetical protein